MATKKVTKKYQGGGTIKKDSVITKTPLESLPTLIGREREKGYLKPIKEADKSGKIYKKNGGAVKKKK